MDIVATRCKQTNMLVGVSPAGNRYIRGHYVAKKNKLGQERALVGERTYNQFLAEAKKFNIQVEIRQKENQP